MPPEAISLALAASIYPPAVAAVIALGRGEEVRLRVFLLVGCALVTVFATGALMLLVLGELPLSGRAHVTRSGGLEVLLGIVLLAVALRLRRKRSAESSEQATGRSRTARYLESRRLVLTLGFILYVVPSPIYVGAVKAISDAGAGTATEIGYLAVVVVVMLWMVELPMVMLLAMPRRSAAVLESINTWMVRNGRTLAVVLATGAGVYLCITGVIRALR